MVSLRSCIKTMAESGFSPEWVVEEITLHSNSNKVLLAYKRLDDSGVLLIVTKWRVIGFKRKEALYSYSA
ncbi:MAG: hypothetical protein NWE91_06120 [Candidatus Bathyarchaeota archaeon]|nr:hypothetical protein [Candidatus Bathyarchaeota archaeon]